MKKAIHIICVSVLVMAPSFPVFAQADVATATIKGRTIDQNGAVVVGATVTAKSLERGTARAATTNSDGIYQIPLLQPGSYEVRVEAAGFQTFIASKVDTSIGQIVVYDIQLNAGAVREEVIVTAAAPLIEVERTHQANTINNLQVENLPNVGRAFTAYVFTLPGVSSSDAPRVQNPGFTFGTSGFSIGGSNGRNNLVTMDGGENEYGSGQLRTNISIEAVQEFQVNRNAFAAEYGFTAGTALNVVTRGGTNKYHGSAYAFYRSQKTSARDFFDRSARKAFDQQVYPGVTFGGPIVRNQAFFFTSYEMLKEDGARFRNYTGDAGLFVPTTAQNSYLNLMANSTNPALRALAAGLRPALTTLETRDAATFKLLRDNEGTFNSPDRLHNWTTRIDYQASDNDSLNGRFSLTHNDTDGIGGGNALSPNAATDLIYRDYTAVGTWIRTFSPNLLNQVRVQAVLNNSAKTLPHDPTSSSMIIGGVGAFGRPFTAPFNTFQDRYQFEDTLAWTKGRHSLKLGGSLRPVNYRVINELWFSGEFTFASGRIPIFSLVPAALRSSVGAFNVANGFPAGGPADTNLTALQTFNLGLPLLYRQGFNNPEWRDWANYLGLFAQDSWKITPRFTVDFGVRYDYDMEPEPLRHKGYLSPRLGFAWDPFGNQKTVIRGGAGVFVSPIYYQIAYLTNILNDSGVYINQIARTIVSAGVSSAAIYQAGRAAGKLPFGQITQADLEALGIGVGARAPGRVAFAADPNYENNYSVQTSLGISRQLVGNLSLEVAYQMYRGVHLQVPHERNYIEDPSICTPTSTVPACVNPAAFGPALRAIDPAATQLNVYSSIGNSIYHGMTASLTKRFSNSFQFQANYTFSKAIDDNTDFNSAFAAFLPTRLDLERAVSAFDIRHNFVANGVFRTPFRAGEGQNFLSRAFADITISPIVFLRSGIPFTYRIGTDVNGDTHTTYDRPFLASRNSGKGERFFSVNLRLNKQFYIARDSGLRLEFIAEGTNLLNRTNFLAVNDVIGVNSPFVFGPFDMSGDRTKAPTQPFGFTDAAAARRIQFGLKVAF